MAMPLIRMSPAGEDVIEGRTPSKWGAIWALAIVGFCLAGCGTAQDRWKSQRPATVLARGVVLYNKQPLAGAVVVFQPTEPGGVGASGFTDHEGRFDLMTFPPESGAVPGVYRVAIIKMDETASSPSPNDAESQAVPVQRSLIPEKYGNAAKSGLIIEIPPQGLQSIQFDLQG